MTEVAEKLTPRQSWAIFTLAGYDVRESDLNKDEASDIISYFKGNDTDFDEDELIKIIEEAGGVKKKDTKVKKTNMYRDLYDEAHAAATKKAEAHSPVPMTVVEHSNPLDDSSPIARVYEPVSDGVCGFAWVNIKPGNHPFCNWLKKNDLGRTDSYYGGVTVWVGDFNQSMEKKEVYAGEFARIINKAFDNVKNFNARAMSRMD